MMSNFLTNIQQFEDKVTNIASEDNDIPAWAVIIVECFIGLISEIKSFNNLSLKLESLEQKFTNLDDLVKVQKVVTDELVVDKARLESGIKELQSKLDGIEQRDRNINLLIHGISETSGEKTDEICHKVINESIKVEISLDEISRSHRLGPVSNSRLTRSKKITARPIIIKFKDIGKRLEVYRAKKI